MRIYYKSPIVFVTFVVMGMLFLKCQKESIGTHAYLELPPDEFVRDSSMVNLMVDSCLLIPIGQLNQKGNKVELLIDGNAYNYNTLDDGLGGYWAVIPNVAFSNQSILKIRITKRNTSLQFSEFKNDSTSAYLKKSMLIDWGEIEIRLKAHELYNMDESAIENATNIQRFVMDNVDSDKTYSGFFGGFTASQTYFDKKGVCINFSRLFIALCRASNIPARSVSGVVYLPGEIGTDCFHHHQWCEFLDDDNQWRTIDLTFTSDIDITDIRYIDFTYCAEETEIFNDYFDEFMSDLGKPFKTDNECALIYAYLPTENHARFGFKLLHDGMPDSLVFEKTVNIKKQNGVLFLNHL